MENLEDFLKAEKITAKEEFKKKLKSKLKSIAEWIPIYGNYLLKKERSILQKENSEIKREYAKGLAAKSMLDDDEKDEEKLILTSFYKAVGCDSSRMFIVSYADNIPWVSRVIGIDKRRGDEELFDPEYSSNPITNLDKFHGRILPLVVLNKKPYHLDLKNGNHLKDPLHFLLIDKDYQLIKDKEGHIIKKKETSLNPRTISKIIKNSNQSKVNGKSVREKVEVPIFGNFKDEYENIEQKVIGVLVADNADSGYKISDNRIETMISAAKNASSYLANARESKQDVLTGLYNRKGLNQYLVREGTSSLNTGQPLSIAVLDIDHFKYFNDTYGHQIGDLALKKIASFIQDSIRQQGLSRKRDVVARYGGEEFVILYSNTDNKGAKIALENLNEKIGKYDFSKILAKNGKHLNRESDRQITISGGIADLKTVLAESGGIYSHLHKAQFISEKEIKPLMHSLIDYADKALYNAKNSGRNKVLVYEKSRKI